jgi:hypothetical protein
MNKPTKQTKFNAFIDEVVGDTPLRGRHPMRQSKSQMLAGIQTHVERVGLGSSFPATTGTTEVGNDPNRPSGSRKLHVVG